MTQATDREIVLTHTFAAPRALVFDAWTRAEHLDRWWGPRGFTTTTSAMDMRPGGEWRYVMKHAEQGEFDNRIRYLEVVPGERLVYDHDSGFDGDPNGFHVTVTFTEVGGRTEVEMKLRLQTAEAVATARKFGAIEGGQQTLERLGELLAEAEASDFVITRELRAPRALVWKVWTEPKHLVRWWGPAGYELAVTRLDLRPGGVFDFSMTAPPDAPTGPMGRTMRSRFEYREIVVPERLVYVQSFVDEHGTIKRHPAEPTWPLEVHHVLTFAERNGVTTLAMRARPINASAEERATYASGHASMQQGFGATFDQLAAYLQEA